MKKIKTITLVTIMVFFIVILGGCEKIVEETDETVLATVTDKYHRSGYFSRVGKTMFWHSANYKVTLTWDGVETTLNNHDLYDKVEIDDKLEVNLHRGYNEDEEVVVSYLELLEDN